MLDRSRELGTRLTEHAPVIVQDTPPSEFIQLVSRARVRMDEIRRGNNTACSMIGEFDSCVSERREIGRG